MTLCSQPFPINRNALPKSLIFKTKAVWERPLSTSGVVCAGSWPPGAEPCRCEVVTAQAVGWGGCPQLAPERASGHVPPGGSQPCSL